MERIVPLREFGKQTLVPIAQVVGYGIGINAFMSTIWIILAIAKAIKTNTLGA